MAAFECSFVKKLDYSIHKWSSYSSIYIPENIQEDKCTDQSSRWSSDTNNPPQYLILKLPNLCIVHSIVFGKYEKTHVCNLKKFKIFGGLNDDNMMELLDSGMKNDSTPETFPVRHTIGGRPFPCRFIKIMPIQSWGPSFNFSIWYVKLMGLDDWKIVKPSLDWFNKYREEQVIRLCLKHFRQHNYEDAFKALQRQTNIQLEDTSISELHDLLVRDGEYEKTELFIEKAISDGFFNDYIGNQPYRAVWRQMESTANPDEDTPPHPGTRGGHQMVIDPYSENIYLFGGWDGSRDLSDLWVYNVPKARWTCLNSDTTAEGGPSPRSCHKMCLDTTHKQIFTLGRYKDSHGYRMPHYFKSDFYVYDIETNQWTLITKDTQSMGGPPLVFDHQMCMDIENNTLYVFGGRVLTAPTSQNDDRPIFSGLYSYHVPTNTWQHLCEDCARPNTNLPLVRSRAGHSMLFHPSERKLLILAGQRAKDSYLTDFVTYDVDKGELQVVVESGATVPAPGFIQRATIDPERGEIYVLSGLSKDKDKREDNVQNSFWVYSLTTKEWTCVYRNERKDASSSLPVKPEPCPRFAYQLVYDSIKKVHYLFGGNPGCSGMPWLRLNDFWRLSLDRLRPDELMNQCRFIIRKSRFEEMAANDRMAALHYLQTTLSEIIDHSDPVQTKEFQMLAPILFRDTFYPLSPTQGESSSDSSDIIASQLWCRFHRTDLFDQLVEFFSESLTQPKDDLVNLIRL